jgi:MFS family permease
MTPETPTRREPEQGFAWMPVATVLLVTFLGTINNNIVNVPMTEILRDLDVPLAEGALVVSSWTLTMAALLPLGGWLGDRIGRRRLFLISVAVLGVAALGATWAPSLPVLVAFRVLQGAASAGITPTVMGLLADNVGPTHRARAVGYWAAANGFGMAVGPPLGGLLTAWFGWRSIFWPTALLATLAVVMTFRFVPADIGRPIRLEWKGALSLLLAVVLLLSCVAAIPALGVWSPTIWLLAAAGVLAAVAFTAISNRMAAPFLSPSLLLDRTFLVSNAAAFAQMFCLGAILLAVPLYLTRSAGRSPTAAGVLLFALPAAMTLLAPLSARASRRWGAIITIRAGLVVLATSAVLLGTAFVAGAGRGGDLVALLVLAGVGVAAVQTPAAHGATIASGGVGAGLGVFSVFRFGGSTCGAAWVAAVLAAGHSYGLVFSGCAVMAVASLLSTRLGLRQESAAVQRGTGLGGLQPVP